MKTVRRYLAAEIYRTSALVLAALVGLFSFFTMMEDLDQVGRHGFKLYHLLMLEALALPTRVYDLLPIALLIGAILALAGFAQRNELVVLRAAGVSGLRLLGQLFLITLPLMLLAIVLAEWITPWSENRVSETRIALTGTAGGAGKLRSGYWFKESGDEGELILNAEQLHPGGTLRGITVFQLSHEKQLQRVIDAQEGLLQDGRLTLQQPQLTEIPPQFASALSADALGKQMPLRTEQRDTLALNTQLTPELLLARALTPERMRFKDLLNYLSYASANGLSAERQWVALWRKLTYPLTLFVMMAIAAPVAFVQVRRAGVSMKVFAGIFLGVGFFMVNQLSLNVGLLHQWPAWLTATGPNALTFLAALAAIVLMESRLRWRKPLPPRAPVQA